MTVSAHVISALTDRLPVLSNGKPRQFRLFCECYEWTFNQHHGRVFFGSTAEEIGYSRKIASALWDHQNPRLARP